MKAVIITQPGAPEVLKVQEIPVPQPGPEEVLIRVQYAGVNRPDLFQRRGNYPAPPGTVQDIPGLEVSGVVEACGSQVHRWAPGGLVCALVSGGGYAEYVVAHQGHCLPLSGVDEAAGAALPETLFTVWHNVFQRGGLEKGQRLLVHGGSGGIGTTAIQLAALQGAEVYTTAGSDARCRQCEALGAKEAINYRTVDFQAHWADTKMDVILDSIGGDYFQRNLGVLREDGCLVQINAVAGRRVELDLAKLMHKRYKLTGSTLRARSDSFKGDLRKAVEDFAWPWVLNGEFKPVIHGILPASEADQAHRMLESGEVFGKLVLAW